MEGAKVAFPMSLWKDVKGHWKGPKKVCFWDNKGHQKRCQARWGCLPHVGCQGMLGVLKSLMFSIMKIELCFLYLMEIEMIL
jgi:hypothetical protein